MKRICITILVLLLAVSLVGCGEQEPLEVTDRYGNEYTIDREQQTISDGENIYKYTYEGDSEDYSITIEYPNGGSYHYGESSGFGSGGGNSKYDPQRYTDADRLIGLLLDNMPKRGSVRKILAALVLIGGGIFLLACPEIAWYWESGWRYKDAEPSDVALTVTRISGVVAVIIGIVVALC